MSKVHQSQYKWLELEKSPIVISEAVKLYGTKEIVGKQHSKEILSWAKEVGLSKTYLNDEIPWCGLFVAVVVKRANFEVMNKFAQNHNGELIFYKNWEQLIAIFKKKEQKELLISESKTITFIDSWILLGVILLLLSIEWILRKYFGKN
jgi:hypothetical protein